MVECFRTTQGKYLTCLKRKSVSLHNKGVKKRIEAALDSHIGLMCFDKWPYHWFVAMNFYIQ